MAVIVESGFAIELAAPLELVGQTFGAASFALAESADFVVPAVGFGASSPAIGNHADVLGVGGSMAQSVPAIRLRAEVFGSSGASELPVIYEAEEPGLVPLFYSHEDNPIEASLKEVFITVFEELLRDGERYVNALGMPHVGPAELVEQSLTANGLSIYRGVRNRDSVGAYLLRAWVARNPKRGLMLLKTYLQLMWPNVWTAKQMWQDKALDYPDGLVDEDGGNHYLTSRVHVTLPARVTNGADLNAVQLGLRASVPARIVMNIAVTDEVAFDIGMASAYYAGAVAQHYEGSFQ